MRSLLRSWPSGRRRHEAVVWGLMMADELVERVARGICQCKPPMQFANPQDDPCSVTSTEDIARELIVAMREPTDEMMFAGAKALEGELQTPSAVLMGIGFSAMIDAALADESEQV